VSSLVFVGIDWSSHHHLMHAVHHVNGSILWPIWTCPSGYRCPVDDRRDGRESRGAVPGTAGIVLRCATIA
jgi:hypothetical protein